MNIIQVVPHYLPARRFGGPQVVAHEIGKVLIKYGNEVKVCTTNLADESNDLDVPIDKEVEVDGVKVFYEQTQFFRYYGFSPLLWKRIKQEIFWSDIVFIHFHYQFANWAGAYLARKYKKPYILFTHGSFNKWGISRKNSFLKKIYLNIIEGKNIKNAEFIAFNAKEEMEQSLFSQNGKIIPSGIDPDKFSDMPKPGSWIEKYPDLNNKVKFLFLGRLNYKQKGLNLLLPAFTKLINLRDDVHLVIAGPDERGGEVLVRKRIQELEIEQFVTITGMVQGKEKKAIFQDCDVFVLPSPSEGLSIALLEALYIGLPVIVTNRVGLSERIAKYGVGIVVEPEIKQLSRALQKLALEQQRLSMKGKGRDLILKNFTWDVISKKLLEQIEEIT